MDRILVLSQVAGYASIDGWLAPVDVARLAEGLRLPGANVSDALTRLRSDGFVVRRATGGQWSLTPAGREHATTLVGAVDYGAVQAEMATAFGAEFLHARHSLIPASLAPARLAAAISAFLREHPFDTNVFLMTRFPSAMTTDDPVQQALDVARAALSRHGLRLHIASERQLADDVLGNVAAHMWAARYGIGVLEDRIGRGLNYNVTFEVGAMLMTGRRCALLKDRSAPASLPSDFAGLIYKSVDLADTTSVSSTLHGWAAIDLQLGACAECPPLPRM